MGYTQYWTLKKPVPTEVWQDVLAAKAKILNASPVPIQDDSTDGIINLNGVDPDDFETFYIDPDVPGWSFCKTARKPYDVVVVAILCAINDIAEDYFEITSDGDRSDWINGNLLARDACGFGFIPSII